YRWFNAGGMKAGLDLDEDGKIDTWKIISAEEVSQEVLQAVLTRDFARLQALWINDTDLRGLEAPAAEVTRIRDAQKKAQDKFQAVVQKFAAMGDVKWEHLEVQGGPQCVPAEQTGMRQDIIKLPRAAILYEANGKHDFLQIGEMILVGLAWKI